MKAIVTSFLVAILLGACAKDVIVPLTDRSPPIVSLYVSGAGDLVTHAHGDAPVSRNVSTDEH